MRFIAALVLVATLSACSGGFTNYGRDYSSAPITPPAPTTPN